MKIPRIRTSLNYVHGQRKSDFEPVIGVSLTVPDMGMSVRTIIDRFRRGLPVNQLMPVYNDDELPDVRRLDLVDIQNLRESVESDIFDLRKLYDQKKDEIEKKRKDDAIAARKAIIEEAKQAIKAESIVP